MATWYRTGTVTVINGSSTVTGSGTDFAANARQGDAFIAPDGKIYEITNIASATVISITPMYLGGSLGAQSYSIAPMQGYVKASADALKAFLAQNIEGGLAIASGGTGATTASGARSNLGLGNVDNTSDLNKPISTATQTALNAKMSISDFTGSIGNMLSPLTWLPLKKNLLTQQGHSICTFTRASTATYIDRYGVLKTAAADTPRFTADGLLIEGASTNLLTYSEQFDNGVWVKGRCTVSANTTATTDPYGTNLADKLIEDTTASATRYVYQNTAFTAGTVYTFSVFVKAAERTSIRLYNANANTGSNFDLTSGATEQGSGNTASIKACSNGWFRCSITFTAASNSSSFSAVYLNSGTGYTGDGISGLYIFGAQLEAMPFATSYIPTTTAAATRAADVCSFPISDNMVKLQQSTGHTFMADVRFEGRFASIDQIALGGDTTETRHALGFFSVGMYSYNAKGGGLDILGGIDTLLKRRYGVVYNGSASHMYMDGLFKGSVSSAFTRENTSVMFIGSANGSRYLFGTISNLRIYDRALTAGEVRLA